MRHPLLLPIEKMFGRKYVKTTMRMLTILREAEEWSYLQTFLTSCSYVERRRTDLETHFSESLNTLKEKQKDTLVDIPITRRSM